jgi:ferredoxin
MADEIFYKLRDILDTIPNGYPSSPDGIEIKILKKIYTEEEAELTTKLRLKYETPDAIALRTGLDIEYLKSRLFEMSEKGQIWHAKIGDTHLYKLLPFVFGIYEFQVKRMDEEFVAIADSYMKTVFAHEYFTKQPALLKVVPIEKEIPDNSVIEPYESISNIIEAGKSWGLSTCICKKEKRMQGEGCENPEEICLGVAPIENYFDNHFSAKSITKEEAYRTLDLAEEAGLVHMVNNFKGGHFAICNCCGCCCGLMRALNQFGYTEAIGKSNFYAVADENLCTGCGICLDRCQVRAITVGDSAEINSRCIGCGLCIKSCPSEAIKLVRREIGQMEYVPKDEKEWMKLRNNARNRGDEYKKLI